MTTLILSSYEINRIDSILNKVFNEMMNDERSTIGNNFQWYARVASIMAASDLISLGESKLETIASSIHRAWSSVAMADYIQQSIAHSLNEKTIARYQLAITPYASLSEVEKEKDRIIARIVLFVLEEMQHGEVFS